MISQSKQLHRIVYSLEERAWITKTLWFQNESESIHQQCKQCPLEWWRNDLFASGLSQMVICVVSGIVIFILRFESCVSYSRVTIFPRDFEAMHDENFEAHYSKPNRGKDSGFPSQLIFFSMSDSFEGMILFLIRGLGVQPHYLVWIYTANDYIMWVPPLAQISHVSKHHGYHNDDKNDMIEIWIFVILLQLGFN